MHTIVQMKFGSHLYGTSTPESDTDFKGIYLPPLRDCILGTVSKNITTNTHKGGGKNTAEDIDSETFSLQEFIRLACKGETVAIDMLHAPADMIHTTSPVWEFLQKHRHLFYTKNMTAFLGYCRKQASKYGVKGSRLDAIRQVIYYLKNRHAETSLQVWWKDSDSTLVAPRLPVIQGLADYETDVTSTIPLYVVCGRKFQATCKVGYVLDALMKIESTYGERARLAELNEGIDWKAVSHAFRVCYQLKHIYTEGELVFPLKECNFLRDIKTGKYHFKNDSIGSKLGVLTDEVCALAEKSTYPQKTDLAFWQDWIVQVYNL